jgi:chromosome segregation ATPase
MRPASSKARQANLSYQAVDEELTDQIKKLTLLEGDRLEFKKQAEDTQAKNQEWIDKLRQENRKLKEQRDDIICRKRANTTVDSRMSKTTTTMGEVRDETYWRRELDKQRFLTKTLRTSLTNMQDKLKDVESNKISYIEESPLMRNIRILENRLDKVMIKYNEANAMRDTYEAVVKRLKEERIGYDNQVTAIERSLKGKESDFEELLLLAHDASHAKEMAQAELKKF